MWGKRTEKRNGANAVEFLKEPKTWGLPQTVVSKLKSWGETMSKSCDSFMGGGFPASVSCGVHNNASYPVYFHTSTCLALLATLPLEKDPQAWLHPRS